MQAQTEVFTHVVRDYMAPPPPIVAPESTCEEVVRRIVDASATSALVVANGGLVGIVTESDVTHRIAFQRSPRSLIGDVMTAMVRTIEVDDFLFHAIARMRKYGLRHMPVVDSTGQVVGVLHFHDALGVAAQRTVDRIDLLSHEGSIEGMKRIKRAQVDVAADLIADDVPKPDIQALLTHINRDIYRRVVEFSMRDASDAGLGAPPVDFSVIIMGSGGRDENYIFPDQDNGFILDDYDDSEHAHIDGYFIELAERMTQTLDSVGFPLCEGYVMATNPLWRKTLSQWRAQTVLWAKRHSTVTLRLTDIFYDFRSVYGKQELADELRDHITKLTKNNPAYLSALYADGEDHGVALGWFGRFITEQDIEEHKGEINLKTSGTLPLVEAVRLLCLKNGITETSTLKRLAALREIGYLSSDELDYLNGAFRRISGLLLRQQVADYKAGRSVDDYVPPENLTSRERDQLIDGLRAIRQLRDRVRSEFTGDLF